MVKHHFSEKSVKLEVAQKVLHINNNSDFVQKILFPSISNYKDFKSGRELKPFNLRPRELLGGFLVSLVAEHITGELWKFGNNEEGFDGVIYCASGEQKNEGYQLEQVYALAINEDLIEVIQQRIANKINDFKNTTHLHLIVYADSNRQAKLDYKEIAQFLVNKDIPFDSIWIISRKSFENCSFNVAQIYSHTDPIHLYSIIINTNDYSTTVKTIAKLNLE